MTDETGLEHDRDHELATALAVPALDAAARTALVRTALGERAIDDAPTGWRHRRLTAALGIAAAILIGIVVGTVVVTQPDDPAVQTAARAPSTTAAREAAKAAAPEVGAGSSDAAAEAPAVVSPPVLDLGELGPVAGPEGLRAAVERRLEAGVVSGPASSPCLETGPGAVAGRSGLVSVTAAGSATLDGRAVALLVGPTRAGRSVVVVLDPQRGCEVVRNVAL